MGTLKTAIDAVLKQLIIVVMGVLLLDVIWQVATRFVLNNPSSFTDELARYLLVWLSLLAGAYALGQRLHLSIDLFANRFSRKTELWLDNLVQLLMFIFSFSVLIIGGSRLVWITLYLDQTSAALKVPLGYVYTVVPLSGLIMCFYCLFFMVQNVRDIRKGTSHIDKQNPGDIIT
ncbi:MAG: TRAP transporter small permease [Bacteroidota bacterium]